MAEEAASTSESVTENNTETIPETNVEVGEKVSEDVITGEEKVQEEAGHKVFVGNLSFQTSEQQLADFFGKTGKVLKANIISRGNRSLGYGFVALETKEDANKVVDELNRQELDGRQINVEMAKPKSENASGNNSGKSYYNSYRGGRGGSNRRYNSRSNAAVTSEDAPALNGTRKPRGSGYRGPSRNTEPSKTDVFVANLPFSVTDESLKEIFNAYDVKSAHVVQYRGQSKGFGFVELASEEEQSKVIEASRTFKSDGRELVVRIAMSNQHVQNEEDTTEKNESSYNPSGHPRVNLLIFDGSLNNNHLSQITEMIWLYASPLNTYSMCWNFPDELTNSSIS
ncbi:9873_t:CDS:2 [Entrophospora sp. SA101]|nr:2552_t:CDS:2 [Entrophospora sp. SA101]CAJ0844535.1 9873_t:CDS:2 [Entrophospora sp. SA101]